MNWEDKIIDYYNNELPPLERSLLEDEIRKDPNLQKLFNEYNVLFNEMDGMNLEEPSENVKIRIEGIISHSDEAQDMKNKTRIIPMNYFAMLKYVAGVAAILLIGVIIGNNISQRDRLNVMDDQLVTLHLQMVEQLKSPSVSERIEGIQVSYTGERVQENPIVETLLETLEHDESPNVRLAAIGALDAFMEIENVRSALIKRLSHEDDSFVLIAIIELLSSHNAKEAIDPLQRLSVSQELPKYVKDEAHWGLIKLEEI